MQPFEFTQGAPETFIAEARKALRQIGFDDIVSLRYEAGELVVVFSRLGTSELRFTITPLATGFRSVLRTSRISPFHAAFREGFERKFAEVVTRTGARLL
jgi:hypothetical protein